MFAILTSLQSWQPGLNHSNPRSWFTNYYSGTLLAKALIGANVPLALLLELRYGWHMAGLPGFDTVCFPTSLSSPSSYPYTPSDAPYHPAVHAAFLFSLVISVLALICKEFCDPGICATLTKDAVMPVRSIPTQNVYERLSYVCNFHIDHQRPRSEKPL
jgi:hypothetical protein